MYIIAWANMLADFNEICMCATPGHDKTPTWFWGILPYFHSYCRNFDAAPPRVIVSSKYYFTAVIIDHFQMKN